MFSIFRPVNFLCRRVGLFDQEVDQFIQPKVGANLAVGPTFLYTGPPRLLNHADDLVNYLAAGAA
jgi:hypothetical protein